MGKTALLTRGRASRGGTSRLLIRPARKTSSCNSIWAEKSFNPESDHHPRTVVMNYQVNFGDLTVASSRPAARKTSSFRIALLGDFSGGANLGRLETGSQLSSRKPLRVDCDNLDAVI